MVESGPLAGTLKLPPGAEAFKI
eukprot:SAG11_NODE_22652_length_402_cov_1.353135_2_plen_22_part_01